eukprot:4928081-Alexandrium_andersonii.AAC.1
MWLLGPGRRRRGGSACNPFVFGRGAGLGSRAGFYGAGGRGSARWRRPRRRCSGSRKGAK